MKPKNTGALSGPMIDKMNPLPKRQSVCVGDKFRTYTYRLVPFASKPEKIEVIWEVIEIKPGGHVELFDKKRTRFWPTYAKTVRLLERIKTI